ncbi:MAG: hypothetical protein GY797_34900, partial [Deltaproteobacteria bacterium]|nr:hypothetical protein [Deltaproteobacteria bacterium]
MEPQTSIQAVLIDTVSIQKYIFASNKLKENLGASYLVQKIYGSVLEDTLKEIFSGQSVDLEKCLQNWKDHPEEILLKQTQNYPFEVGYIGGGNALLLFREEKKARKFVEKWTVR